MIIDPLDDIIGLCIVNVTIIVMFIYYTSCLTANFYTIIYKIKNILNFLMVMCN